ncbi:alpha/beta fold hydrolase [Nocardia jejuensis]|uniref:alpha/beta fold hydrolase n=1 Tax=Nocardia jejuensis TaxID=328049 RepID=UPI000833839F|nr:alpha/beta fold hydrolase [Nocardia jejuensis]
MRRILRVVAVVAVVALALALTLVSLELLRIRGDEEERPGIAAFYQQPPGAAEGMPGTVVKSEALIGNPVGARAWRIMYRSTDAKGEPVVVTGTVITPVGPAPKGGRTVLAWGHPTTGAAPDCAPSRGFDPFLGIEGLRFLLDRGYTVVATDYAGMGTDGPDSYLIGQTEAHSVLDAVRAARTIPDAEAGTSVVLWGHSQGGQAVLFAAENAHAYAPELSVVAVAAAAPAADLTALMRTHANDISGVTIGAYAFTAFSEAYGAQLQDILTTQARAVVPQMNQLCLLSNLTRLHELGQPLIGDFTTHDPTTTAPWDGLLAQNSAGAQGFAAPLFIAQGRDDELVVPADTDAFVAHEKGLGIDLTYEQIPGATHATIAYLAIPALLAWLDRVGH